MEIQLGQKVKCRVTGFEGIAICIGIHNTGQRRISIQPPVHEGKIPESEDLDEGQLIVLDTKRVIETEPNTEIFKMHDKVRCKTSGLEGVVVARATWLNGCHRMRIQPPVDKDKKAVFGTWIDELELELVEETKRKEPKRKTGGPQAANMERLKNG